MSENILERKIAVIFVADVVQYSKHMENDEVGTLRSYSACEEILLDLLNEHVGSVFNTAGDSVLVEFNSAVNAVECAVEFQNKIQEKNSTDNGDVKLEFRIGINMGDVIVKDGNLLGDGVNIAARLEALSQPNGICISKSVYDLVIPKTKMTFNDLGVQKVKQNEFHAFDILLNPAQKRKIKSRTWGARTLTSFMAIAVLTFILVSSTLFFLNQNSSIGQNSDSVVLLVRPFDYITSGDDKRFVADSMLTVFVAGLSGYEKFRVLSKNTSLLVEDENLTDTEVAQRYGANFILNGSITALGDDMRTSIEIRNLTTNEIQFSDLINGKTQDLFDLQDKLVVSVLSSFDLEEDKVRVSNEGIETIEELRLLHFAAKEREKWTVGSYPAYADAVDKLFALNPEGYTQNVSQAWKYHYKMRLGLCRNEDKKNGSTNCMIEAIKFVDKAVELNPSKADAYLAKSYFLSSLYLLNRDKERMMEWGGLEKAAEVAEKGYALISDDPYQFGLAGEVFTFTNDFEKSANAFAKLFKSDDNPGDTFTQFYMISSYLNNDLEKMRELAFRIIETNNSREVDTCTKPSCGNAAYAYLFLIYEANQNNDQKKVNGYLQDFRSVRNEYTREMWMSRDNPARFIWKEQFEKITAMMDQLGWSSV
jgi:class 3 adenylate cyclase/TolB-like protein